MQQGSFRLLVSRGPKRTSVPASELEMVPPCCFVGRQDDVVVNQGGRGEASSAAPGWLCELARDI